MPAPPSPASRVMVSAAKMAARFAVPTMDRSMPPVSMVIMMAKARMPYSGNCTAIDCRLAVLGNLPGSRMLNTTKMRIAITSRRSAWLSPKMRAVQGVDFCGTGSAVSVMLSVDCVVTVVVQDL